MILADIVGMNVVAVKGYKHKYQPKNIVPQYIFFDDGETYIELREQDDYDYHDCCSSARMLYLHKNEVYYDNLFCSPDLKDANVDI